MHLKIKYKLSLLIISFFTLIIIFLLLYFIPRNYSIKYKKDSFLVCEEYKKKDNLYIIDIGNFTYYINSNYSSKRRLVNNIKKNSNCVTFNFKDFEYNICKNKSGYYMNYYKDKIAQKKIKSYKNIDIYDYNNNYYYIWNYNGFIILDHKTNELMSIFDRDVYSLDYITLINNDILVADYNQKYSFNKFLLINTVDKKYEELDFLQNFSFDGYILGTYKDYVYLFDNKSLKEYKFNPYTKDITKISYRILNNKHFETISLNKLQKNKYFFTIDQDYYYFINNNKLYFHNFNQDILVSNLNVDKILKSNNNEVYYLVKDKLYYNNIYTGNKLLMSYSEWNFNNKNIYIFNNEK